MPISQNNKIKILFTLAIFALFFFLPSISHAATLYWVGGAGDSVNTNANDWSTTNPASCNDGGGDAGAVPGASDLATFDPDCDSNASVGTSWSVAGISMVSGYIGEITQSATVTVGTSDFTQAGGTWTAGAVTFDDNDSFTISGGTFTAPNASGAFTVSGNFTQSGTPTFTANSGTLTLDGTLVENTSIDASGVTFNKVVFNRTTSSGPLTLTIVSGTTIPLGDSPTVTLTTSNGTAYNLTNNGTITAGTGTLTMSLGYQGAGTFTNSGTVTANSITSWVVTGFVSNSGAISMTGNTSFDFNKSFTNSGTATFSTGASPTMTIAGSLTVANTSTFQTGANITMDGSTAGAFSIDANGVTFNSIVMTRTAASGSSLTIASNTTVPLGNSPTISLTTTNGEAYNLINNGTITAGTGTLTITLGWSYNGTFTNAGTVTANSITSWVSNSNVTNSSIISMTGNTSFNFDGSFTNSGTATFSTGASPTMTVGGSWGGNFTVANTSTFPSNANLTLDGDSSVNTSIDASGVTFGTVVLNKNNTAGCDGAGFTFTIVSGTTVPLGNSPTISIIDGYCAQGRNLTNNGTITVGTGTLTVNLSGGTFTNNGTIQTKTVTRSGTAPTNATNSTVIYTGDGDAAADTQTITSFATTYYNLTINSTDGTTDIFALGSAPTVNNNVTVTAGVLSTAGNNLSATGSITVASGAILRLRGDEVTVTTPTLSSGSTVEYTGTSGPYTLKNWTYHHLTINGVATTFNLPATTDVNGNLTITAGTLDATVSNYNITLAGNWSNSGTFTPQSGTVTLDGTNQTISGSTTFNNLSKTTSSANTLTFTAGTTQTIAGTMTLQGAWSKQLSLRSSSAGTQWSINPQSTRTIGFLDVKDSNNTNATAINAYGKNNINSGNNTNWVFDYTPPPPPTGFWYNQSWGYRKRIVIDYTKVSGDQTNFPVLVNLSSDSSLATNAQADSDDILFTSANGTTKLDHEIEKYTTATGELVAWVEVPSLSSSANTVLYMYYGNSAATSQQNATGVWDANYKGAWHLKDGTTLSGVDSTSNANTGTINNATATAGNIDGAANFDGNGDYVDAGNGASLKIAGNAVTVSVWVKATALSGVTSMALKWGNTNNTTAGYGMYTNGTGYSFAISPNGNDSSAVNGLTALSTGTWYHIVGVYDGVDQRIYRNGVSDATPVAQTSNIFNNNISFAIGAYFPAGVGGYFNGVIDDVRVSNVARSAGWILTEYNNQNSPSTFYSLGNAESTTPPSPSLILFSPGAIFRAGIIFR